LPPSGAAVKTGSLCLCSLLDYEHKHQREVATLFATQRTCPRPDFVLTVATLEALNGVGGPLSSMVDRLMVTYGQMLYARGVPPEPPGLCVMEDGTLVDEAAVQTVWAAGLEVGDELRTADGRPLKILSPGWHGRGDGPDFASARIELDGTELSGDVEIELQAAGWYAHGHHLNPRFAGVILHVFLEPNISGRATTTIDDRRIPQLCLADLPLDIPLPSGEGRSRPATVVPEGRCGCGPGGRRSPREVLTLLGAAGDWRLLAKSVRLDGTLEADGADTIFYEGMLGALGYRAYKLEFGRLARQLPYRVLRAAVEGLPREETVESLRAVYLGSAGLLPRSAAGADQYVVELNTLWDRLQPALPPSRPGYYAWRRSGVRPANGPERRLAAAAALVERDFDRGIAARWIDRLRTTGPERDAPGRFIDALTVPADGYWTEHYGFAVSGRSRGERLVGRARANEILVNAILPATLAVARRDEDEPLRNRVLSVYSRLPRGERNSVTTLMRDRLFPDSLPRGKYRLGARHQQGMLQVYNDWCAGNPGCTDCPMLDDRLTGE